MNARTLLPALVLTTLVPLATGRAAELRLDVVRTSPSEIELRWARPADPNGFDHYDVLRSGELRVPAPGAAFGILAGALLAAALLARRRRLAATAALALGLGAGLQAAAAIIYERINPAPITDIGATSYVDRTVEAGKGYYYKVQAVFSDRTEESVCRFGSAEDPLEVPSETGLVVEFQPGEPPNQTPEDGTILDGSNNITVNGCIAVDQAICDGARAGRVVTIGEVGIDRQILQNGLNGPFNVPASLNEGPNFVRLHGENDSGKSVTVARTVSVGQSANTGTLIQKAVGVVVSPAPADPNQASLLEKLHNEINDQTPADWNEILALLPYPIVIDVNEPQIKLHLEISQIRMAIDGDITVNTLQLDGNDSSGAVVDADLIVDGVDARYTAFEGEVSLTQQLTGYFCPGSGLNRIHFGRVQLRARARVFVEAGQLRLDLMQLNSAPFLQDLEGGLLNPDRFDTDRRIGANLQCIGALDLDQALFPAINSQLDTLFPVDLTEATISDIALGDTGLTLDLTIAEISQDAAGKGLVVRADAAVDSLAPVPFLFTANPPPNGSANNSVFPDAFPTSLDAGLTVADDLANQALAAAHAAGLLDSNIEGTLKVGDQDVPLTVAGLDPGPTAADSLVPNLSRHAPRNAPVRIVTRSTLAPVVGLQDNPARSQDGLRVMVTGSTAAVLVDVDLDGAFDPECETALTLDLDVLGIAGVSLTGEGALQLDVELPVQGYTATPGFLGLPHATLQRFAGAVIAARIGRILDLINGVGNSGLVIPGLSFSTLEAVADGDPNSTLYLDNLTAWGAATIDLKELILEILGLINEQP
jgi:hypothetical protein